VWLTPCNCQSRSGVLGPCCFGAAAAASSHAYMDVCALTQGEAPGVSRAGKHCKAKSTSAKAPRGPAKVPDWHWPFNRGADGLPWAYLLVDWHHGVSLYVLPIPAHLQRGAMDSAFVPSWTRVNVPCSQVTCRQHAGNMQVTCRQHAGNMQVTCRHAELGPCA
jgi:hypothetical protein